MKKRFLVSILNFFFFWITFGFIGNFIELFIVIPIWFILYFCFIPKITNGYTLGGFLLGLKVIKLDNSQLNISECLKRTFNAFFTNLKFFMFMIFTTLEVNSLGQLPYDQKYNTTVIDVKKYKNINLEDIQSYKFTYYDFIVDIVKLWGLFFIFIFLTTLIQYLFSLVI